MWIEWDEWEIQFTALVAKAVMFFWNVGVKFLASVIKKISIPKEICIKTCKISWKKNPGIRNNSIGKKLH